MAYTSRHHHMSPFTRAALHGFKTSLDPLPVVKHWQFQNCSISILVVKTHSSPRQPVNMKTQVREKCYAVTCRYVRTIHEYLHSKHMGLSELTRIIPREELIGNERAHGLLVEDMQDILPQLPDIIQNIQKLTPGSKIIFTGFSTGAAMAQILILLINMHIGHYARDHKLIALASPMVGNMEFSRLYNAFVSKSFNYCIALDQFHDFPQDSSYQQSIPRWSIMPQTSLCGIDSFTTHTAAYYAEATKSLAPKTITFKPEMSLATCTWASNKIKAFLRRSTLRSPENLLKPVLPFITAMTSSAISMCDVYKICSNPLYQKSLSAFLSRCSFLIKRSQGNSKCYPQSNLPDIERNIRETQIDAPTIAYVFLIQKHPCICYANYETFLPRESDLIAKADACADGIKDLVLQIKEKTKLDKRDWISHQKLPVVISSYFEAYAEWQVPDELQTFEQVKENLFITYHMIDSMQKMIPHHHIVQTLIHDKENLRIKLVQTGGPEIMTEVDVKLFQNDLFSQQYGPENEAELSHLRNFVPKKEKGALILNNFPLRNLSKEQIIHELALDLNFSVPPDGRIKFESTAVRNVQNQLENIFWDSLIEDINQPKPNYERIRNVFQYVLAGFKNLTPGSGIHKKLSRDINRMLDLGDLGKLEWNTCIDVIESLYKAIDSIHFQRSSTAPMNLYSKRLHLIHQALVLEPCHRGKVLCDCIRNVLALLNHLSIEDINANIKRLLSQIHGEHIHYLKCLAANKFTADLSSFKNLTRLHGECKGSFDSRQTLQLRIVITLLIKEKRVSETNCPENLIQDLERLKKLQNDLRDDVASVAMLTLFDRVSCSPLDQAIRAKLVNFLNQHDSKQSPIVSNNINLFLEFIKTLSSEEKLSMMSRRSFEDYMKPLSLIPPQIVGEAWIDRILSQNSAPCNIISELNTRITRNTERLNKTLQLDMTIHGFLYDKLMQ